MEPSGAPCAGARFRGQFKSWHAKRGYGFGFIKCPELQAVFYRDIFLNQAQRGNLKVGAQVTFTVTLSQRGMPQAREVVDLTVSGGSARRRPKPCSAALLPHVRPHVQSKPAANAGSSKGNKACEKAGEEDLRACEDGRGSRSLVEELASLKAECGTLQKELAGALEREKAAATKAEAAVKALAKGKEDFASELAALQAAACRRCEKMVTAAGRERKAHDKEMVLLKAKFGAELNEQQLLCRCLLLWHSCAEKARCCIRRTELMPFKQERSLEEQEFSSAGLPLLPGQPDCSPCSSQAGQHQEDECKEKPTAKYKASTPALPRPQRPWRRSAYTPKEEALYAQLLDPILLELMKDPVMAPDGTSYDFTSITTWISESPTDPRTRLPLNAGMLRVNRQARALLSLFRLHFPQYQAPGPHIPRKSQAPDPARDLFEAIITWDARRALEILAGAVEDEILNGQFEHKGKHGSLLFWAMSFDLPTVAVALIRRNDFRELLAPTPLGMSHLHYAAAVGFSDVCQELLKRLPLPLALSLTQNNVELGLDGTTVMIPVNSSAMAIARQMGHDEICELFNLTISNGHLLVL